ncbi:hypothetical protein [Comamonas jiangduensis]|uniref:hypothetical protein n=1 Tax=Comamonas jiangduensis TaxID=1194168 RepID=UPI003BF8A1C6
MSFDYSPVKKHLGPADVRFIDGAKDKLDSMRAWGSIHDSHLKPIEAALSWLCVRVAEQTKDRMMDHAAMDALREQLNAAEKRIERLQEKLSGGAGSHANGN